MNEGLAQGSYLAAKVGFKPATLQTQGTKLTTEPPCPTIILDIYIAPLQETYSEALSVQLWQKKCLKTFVERRKIDPGQQA